MSPIGMMWENVWGLSVPGWCPAIEPGGVGMRKNQTQTHTHVACRYSKGTLYPPVILRAMLQRHVMPTLFKK